jgi:hypothetical protein
MATSETYSAAGIGERKPLIHATFTPDSYGRLHGLGPDLGWVAAATTLETL